MIALRDALAPAPGQWHLWAQIGPVRSRHSVEDEVDLALFF
jgi:hypothetical protein